MQQAYIIAAKRTAIGKANRGQFKYTRPDDLLINVIQAALAEVPNLDSKQIDDIVIGNAFPEAEQGFNIARMAAQLAGLPEQVPGLTINRWCSSGLNAIQIAADRIRLGEADIMIAGGVESMSRVPMIGNTQSMNPKIFEDDHVNMAYGMGITAENVASDFNISREDQDTFALESHRRAIQAIQNGTFKKQISPMKVINRIPDLAEAGRLTTIETLADTDEGPRADTTLEALAKLRPVFKMGGSVTAGNSSQTSDGAAVVILVSEKMLEKLGIKPLARYCTFSVKGVAPEVMGIGPKEAIPAACQQVGISQNELQWIELNEAFAAQALAVIRDLDLDPEKTNPTGGAIALGHPLGGTGTILTTRLIHGMRYQGKTGYGMVSMCIGGGMGAAGIFEIL
ncbi:Acetyl-CoA acetyltransferase [Suttonella ornithocola]|uniref:acetyl-CoA C-acyltransferase n=2 Tax=Suttonella ornithocola TaxID=279832 RepID=A0A380MY09_9GAMM|nr:Acetyl-CoA acetyltransferase [Suttonella ornithocola]